MTCSLNVGSISDYISAELRVLINLAKHSQMDHLTYILNVALLESQEQGERHQTDSIRIDNPIQTPAIGSWKWDLRTDIVVCAPNVASLWGVSEESAQIGYNIKAFWSGVDPMHRRTVRRAIKKSVDHGDPYRAEFRSFDKFGNPYWIVARGQCIRDGDMAVSLEGTATGESREVAWLLCKAS